MKNLIKSIILSGLLFASSLPVVNTAVMVHAAEEVEYETTIDKTSPLADLRENREFKEAFDNGDYMKAESDDSNNKEGIYPVSMAEWHYGYSDYGIYIYIWNKTQYDGFDLESNKNFVTLLDLKTGTYNYHRLTLKSRNGNQFYKFKVEISNLNQFSFMTEDGARSYSFGSIMLNKKDASLIPWKTYKYGQKITWTGDVAKENLHMSVLKIQVLSVDVKGGTYRTSSSSEGLMTEYGYHDASMTHNDIHYVYFNIPDSYISEYGNVAEYHFSYHPVLLKPIAYMVGEDLDDEQYEEIVDGDDEPDFENNYYGWWLHMKKTHQQYLSYEWWDRGFYDAYYGDYWWSLYHHHFNYEPSRLQEVLESFRGLSLKTWNYKTILIDNPGDNVTSYDLDSLINTSTLSEWASLYFNGKKYKTFDELMNNNLIDEHLRYDQENYVLKSFDESENSYFEKMWRNQQNGYEVGEDIVLTPIQAVDSSNISSDKETYALEDNVDKIQEFHNNYIDARAGTIDVTGDGIGDVSTPYVFRFYQSICSIDPLYFADMSNENRLLGRYENDVNTRVGSIFNGYGIYDLESIDLTFEKEVENDVVQTLIPIVADPIDINPPLDPAEIPEGIEDVPNAATSKESGESLWDSVMKILRVIGIFFLVVLGIWLVLKIIGWTRAAFKS